MGAIVITGSTRGIGLGLARAFVELGREVMVSGRTRAAVDGAVAELAGEYGEDRVGGKACDVTDLVQLQALWDAATARFGGVDVWINNAGIANSVGPVWELDAAELATVVQTNVVGAMLGCKVAIAGMLGQGGGAVYNMEGLGSDGRKVEGLTPYGATKRAVAYLTEALAAEVKGTPVLVGGIRPGMVITDMLMRGLPEKGAERDRYVKVYDTLADRVETVAPWVARQVADNRKNGKVISWLTGGKVMWRFATAGITGRKVVGEGRSL